MAADASPGLRRSLGLFDASMLVMGGIVGAGIFMNPSVVARLVHTPALVLGAWAFGGLIALAGAFVYAELAARRPETGGQYAYFREAFSPGVAFVYGWSLLFVTQSGGIAAVAVTFATYFIELTGTTAPASVIAAVTLAILTLVNCLGVRVGSTIQNVFMVLKIGAIVALVAVGIFWTNAASPAQVGAAAPPGDSGFATTTAFAAALVPVLFAYGGWNTAGFASGELRDARRDMSRGLVFGVIGVIVLYLAVSAVCQHTLGVEGLAATNTPASEVMRRAFGDGGARFIAVGIAVSTFGFLAQGMLTNPRVYYAMAQDGLFLRSVGWVHPSTRVPVVAIALQGAFAIAIAASGRYEQILNYVVSVDYLNFGLAAVCLFVLRRRDVDAEPPFMRVPGHPWTTLFFVAACWLVVANLVVKDPGSTLIGYALVCTGVPAYLVRKWWMARR